MVLSNHFKLYLFTIICTLKQWILPTILLSTKDTLKRMISVSLYTGTIFGSILLAGSILMVIFVLRRKKIKHKKENKTTQITQGLLSPTVRFKSFFNNGCILRCDIIFNTNWTKRRERALFDNFGTSITWMLCIDGFETNIVCVSVRRS